MKETKYDTLQNYLEGSLSDAEQKHALLKIAEDAELRAMLTFELNLSQLHNQVQNNQMVPAGFTDNVMDKIDKSMPDKYEPKNKGIGSIGMSPSQKVFNIAAVILLMIMSVVVVNLYMNQTSAVGHSDSRFVSVADEQQDEYWMRFVYVDDSAETLSVAGDFSNWEPIELNKRTVNGDVVWTGIVPLSRGEHRYMFVKDEGEWITDPLAENFRDDGFGNKNAVIVL